MKSNFYLRLKNILLPLFAWLLLAISLPGAAQTVTTDKADYLPGEHVTISGTGWLPEETVNLLIEHLVFTSHPDQSLSTTADASGSLTPADYTIDEWDLGEIFKLTATGQASSSVATTSFTDAGGNYTIDFSAYDPELYEHIIPGQVTQPIGRSNSPLSPTDHNETVESLMPEYLGLGQIVAFELYVTVTNTSKCPNDEIQMVANFSTKTGSGDLFGFDKTYMVYAAFVDASSGGGIIDNGTLASVTSFSSVIVPNGAKENIQGTINLAGLDPGDAIPVEVWVVLQSTLPGQATGNVPTEMVSAKTIGTCEGNQTINAGNQTVPLNQVGSFTTVDTDLSVVKVDDPDPVNLLGELTYKITVYNAGPSVANTVTVTDLLDPNTTFISWQDNDVLGSDWTFAQTGQTLTFTSTYMDIGESADIFVKVSVNNTAPATSTGGAGAAGTSCTGDLVNKVSASTITDDIVPGNNSWCEPTGVNPPADLTCDATGDKLLCPEESNGEITVTWEGGMVPYTVELYLGEALQNTVTTDLNTTTFTGLLKGDYSIMVKTLRGGECTKAVSITVADAPLMTLPANLPASLTCAQAGDFVAPPATYTNGETGEYLINGEIPAMLTSSWDACGGTIIVLWEQTVACGYVLSSDDTITVEPAPAATFDAVAPQTITCSEASTLEASMLKYSNDGLGGCLIEGDVLGTLTPEYTTCGGTITQNWSFTDDCGRKITQSSVITVLPAPAPAFDPVADITVTCGAAAPSSLHYTNGETGACEISGDVESTFSTLKLAVAGGCGEEITETWTIDHCGTPISVSRTIVVEPAAEPVFATVADTTVECGAAVPRSLSYTNGLEEECLISGSVMSTISATTSACGEDLTETWTATYCGDHSITKTRIIHVLPAPVTSNIVFPTLPETLTCAEASAYSSAPDVTYTNEQTGVCNISGTLSATIQHNWTTCDGGTITVVYSGNDACGRPISALGFIPVTKAPAAQLTLPTGLPTNLYCADAVAFTSAPDATYSNELTGNCENSGTIPASVTSNWTTCRGGTIDIVWSGTDDCGNNLSGSQSIFVHPSPEPQLTTPTGLPTRLTCAEASAFTSAPDATYTNGETGTCGINGTIPALVNPRWDACRGGDIVVMWEKVVDCDYHLEAFHVIPVSAAPAAALTLPMDLPTSLSCAEASAFGPVADATYSNDQTGSCENSGTIPAAVTSNWTLCDGGSIDITWSGTDKCGRALSESRTIQVNQAPLAVLTLPTLPETLTREEAEDFLSVPDATFTNSETGACQNSGTIPGEITTKWDMCYGGTILVNYSGRDECGRELNSMHTITVTPPEFTLSLGECLKTDVLCNGESNGSVTAGEVTHAIGTVIYSWENSSGVVVGTGETVSNLPAGTYTLTVNDDCFSKTCQVLIGEPDPISVSITADVDCELGLAGFPSGTVTVTGSGFATLQLWSVEENVQIGSNVAASGSHDFNNLPSGSYYVIALAPNSADVADACNATSNTAIVDECYWFNIAKLTQGSVDPTKDWQFKIYEGPDGYGKTSVGSGSSLNDADGILNFGNVNLNPSKTYTICEEQMAAGWSAIWITDINGTATVLMTYNPQGDETPPADLGNRCFDIGKGTSYPLYTNDVFTINVDNTYPGGTARTPGYWKNWNTCTNGGQAANAKNNGGWREGYWLLNDVLNSPGVTLGAFTVITCETGVSILDQRDLKSGKKSASDPVYTLAMHLMAFKCNQAAGAYGCPYAIDAAAKADVLLKSVGYNAQGSYTKKLTKANASYALTLAKILDEYNNNRLTSTDCAKTVKSAEIIAIDLPATVEPSFKAYPNPFTDQLNIEFSTAFDAQAKLEIYSVTGAKLETLFDAPVSGGQLYTVQYLPKLVSSQIVIYHLTIDGKTQIGKLIYNERK